MLRKPYIVSWIGSGRTAQAFFLVELLATLVLCAVVLPVALEGISLATKTASLTKNKILAASLAENKLNELLHTEGWRDGDQQGDFDPDYPQFHWQAQTADWQGTVVQQVSVEVSWEQFGHQRSVQILTLVFTEVQS